MIESWNYGSPPYAGWWHTGWYYGKRPIMLTSWRWWDGKSWSAQEYEEESRPPKEIKQMRSGANYFIQWSTYWPENARVPRFASDAEKGAQ